MTLPQISIIVPVYKAEKVMSRCLESILNQTFKDWELILVDDGSPDRSGELCERYKCQDSRIIVIHQPNGGVSSARNAGLKQAQGDYVTFVDADDYLYSNYLDKLFSHTPADIVICGFENIENTFIPQAYSVSLKDNSTIIKTLVEVPYYLDTPWCKLFKRSIIVDNNLSFNRRLRLSEDTLFCYEFIKYCEIVKIESSALYVYDGVWGGGSKYELNYDELNYASQMLIGAIEDLNQSYGTNIDVRHKCFHLSKLRSLFSDYTDIDVYKLYIQSHPVVSFGDFMADGSISPLTIGMGRTIDLVKVGQVAESRRHLADLKSFLTQKIKRFPSINQKLFYTILDLFGVNVALLMVKGFIVVKNTIHT